MYFLHFLRGFIMLFELKNFFYSKEEIMCYNSVTKTVYKFKEVRAQYPFLYCKDEKYQYIINGETGETVYENNSNRLRKMGNLYRLVFG